jgi:dephospho-CoA kinase
MHLIGLTGTHGAGKGTITEYLVREHGFLRVSVSEFLAHEATRRGMSPDRPTRSMIANEYRAQGQIALMEATYASIPQGSERVVLEPQYTVDEVRFIHEKGGIVIAVDADLETRYARVHVRGSAKDDVSFEQFKEVQERELDSSDQTKQNIAQTMKRADVLLMNNGTVEEFEAQVRAVLVEYKYL